MRGGLAGGEMKLILFLSKAEQLSLFGPASDPKAPGSRGGKFYRTETGRVRYGEPPPPPKPPAAEPQPGPARVASPPVSPEVKQAGPPKQAPPRVTLDTKSENYAYKDIGYVPGSRKELAQQAIRLAAKDGRQVHWEDVDWSALEENSRAAESLITKGHVFGDVDWKAFEAAGMEPGAGYLIRAIYASVATEPDASDLLRRQASGGADEGGIYSMKRAQDPMQAITARLRSAVTIEDKQALFRELGGESLLPKLVAASTPAEREAVLRELGALVLPKQGGEIAVQARQDYVRGINTLRQRMEACKSPGDVLKALEEIAAERGGTMLSAEDADRYAAMGARRRELFQQGREYQQALDALSKPAHLADGEYRTAKYEQSRRADRGWKADPMLDAQVANLEAVKTAAWEKFLAAKRDEEEKVRDAEIRNLGHAMRSIEIAARKRNLNENLITRAWHVLGERFAGVLAYRSDKGSQAFARNVAVVRAGRIKDWSWAESEPKARGGGATKESVRFQLLVADQFDRVGGRPSPIASSADLQAKFNLRAVQSGNWVLRDVNSGKFHMEQCAAAFADLADVLGIDDHLVSMNGRLAMAFGARGKGGAKAHYEPIERVINITKMEGAGSLGHEWFHSLDNLMLAAYGADGADLFGSNMPPQNTVLPPAVGAAFENLNRAMTAGDVRQHVRLEVTPGDDALVRANMQPDRLGSGWRHVIAHAGSLEHALEELEMMHAAMRFGRGRRGEIQFNTIRRIAAAWWTRDKADTERSVAIPHGKPVSRYLADARNLNVSSKPAYGPENYWSQRHEMAARAFAAYLSDKLEAVGRRNDYLTFKADNRFYSRTGARPYPDGEERVRINAAFDRLFEALKGVDAFRKAAAVLVGGSWWQRWLAKAEQLAFSGFRSQPATTGGRVKRPGLRGGRYWIDKKGVVRYGSQPQAKETPRAPTPPPPAPKPEREEWMDEEDHKWERERHEHEGRIKHLASAPMGLVHVPPRGPKDWSTWMLTTRDTYPGSPGWRTTMFDERGPYTHHVGHTPEESLSEALSRDEAQRAVHGDAAKFQEFSQSERFVHGVRVLHIKKMADRIGWGGEKTGEIVNRAMGLANDGKYEEAEALLRPYLPGGRTAKAILAWRTRGAIRSREQALLPLRGGRQVSHDGVPWEWAAGRILCKAEQLSFAFGGGEGSIKQSQDNYLGTDKRGRAHWRAKEEAPAAEAPPAAKPTVKQLVDNAVKAGKESHHVAAAASMLGHRGVQSLCSHCLEKVDPNQERAAHRLPRGGECSQCSYAGQDALVVEGAPEAEPVSEPKPEASTSERPQFEGYKAWMGDQVVWVVNRNEHAKIKGTGEETVALKVLPGIYRGVAGNGSTIYGWGEPKWVRESLVSRRRPRAKKPPVEPNPAEDYRQHGTRAKAFLAWFGDWVRHPESASKVLNAKGEPAEEHSLAVDSATGAPVAVYHGTPHGGWTTFDVAKANPAALYGQGFYFTDNKTIAEGYKGDASGTHTKTTPQTIEHIVKFIRRNLPPEKTHRPMAGDEDAPPLTVSWAVKRDKFTVWSLGGGRHQEMIAFHLKQKVRGEWAQDIWISSQSEFLHDNAHALVPEVLGWDEAQRRDWDLLTRSCKWRPDLNQPEVKTCYLNIRYPFVVDRIDATGDNVRVVYPRDSEAIERITSALKEVEGRSSWAKGNEASANFSKWLADTDHVITGQDIFDRIQYLVGVHETSNVLQLAGYDGISHVGGLRSGDRKTLHRVWIAFRPEQIKAVDNEGTFDASNPDILKASSDVLAARERLTKALWYLQNEDLPAAGVLTKPALLWKAKRLEVQLSELNRGIGGTA